MRDRERMGQVVADRHHHRQGVRAIGAGREIRRVLKAAFGRQIGGMGPRARSRKLDPLRPSAERYSSPEKPRTGTAVKVSRESAAHYTWGVGCDGWILSPSPDLMVIQERMPPGTVEQRHFHSKARQFFYVLSGELIMEMEGELHSIPAMSGIEVPPGAKHQARNDSENDAHFLVISSPTTRGDRTDLG